MKATYSSLLAGLLTVTLVGCRPPELLPVQYLVFVDLSDSVASSGTTQWSASLTTCLSPLKPGDSVEILPITEDSLAAGPLRSLTVPALARNADFYAKAKANADVRSAQDGALKAVKAALADPQGVHQTDVLGAIDKASAQRGNGTTVIIWLTDALNATRELNMESNPLPPNTLPQIVAEIARRHGWNRKTLGGAGVVILLTDNPHTSHEANDRLVLGRFWDLAIQSAGGRLVAFATDLNSFPPAAFGEQK